MLQISRVKDAQAYHLHLNSQVCRLGVSLPMSVGTFH